VFIRSTDNQLMHKWWYGTRWSGWEPLGGTLTSAPGAVAWAPGRIDVVARDSGNGIQHTWFDGAWHPFESLGGASAGDRAAGRGVVGHRAPGRLLDRRGLRPPPYLGGLIGHGTTARSCDRTRRTGI
jgi:Repeat of unknown function (DUF346)